MGPKLVFENLTLGYDRHPAVHHLDTAVDGGSLTAIVGPNGAGKSTLLKGIAGVLTPFEGRIVVGNGERHRVAYLPQQAEIDRSFPVSVRDMVSLGLWRRIGPFGSLKSPDTAKVAEALDAVGLTGFEQRPINTLSGGQLQRMLFARLLLQDASLILLDEPFTAIDAKAAADLIDVVKKWHAESRTVIAVLHDIDQVQTHFPNTLLLGRELIANGTSPTVLTEPNLARARQLCEAFDEKAPECHRGHAA